ncbi:MAG TPA: tetraacyldisaccharide 4'-kinase [Xanthobacteraceae bacterium]|nr:tetraacyldisaccharide 4'-kinase [Xanthobacteraceae bacterium]
MHEPAFWWQPGSVAETLLAPLAVAYGALAGARLALPGRAAGVPVICVGNFTVGGAGKTPTALAIGRLLIAAGRRPFFLSRGYGGRLAGPVLVDAKHRAADVGDEPLLLARIAPTIVARNRAAGAEAARLAGAEVIVMDDGFQNPSLVKDFSLLVVDGRRGVGNGSVLPAGPLRAPLASQLARAHAVLVVGAVSGAEPVVVAARSRGLPIFHGRLVADAKALDRIREHKVFAFAGIADPDKFFATLEDARIDIQLRYAFPDHHPYRGADILALLARAEHEGLVLVTTEKDFVRLSGVPDAGPLLEVLRVIPVTLAVDEAEEFQKTILGAVGR